MEKEQKKYIFPEHIWILIKQYALYDNLREFHELKIQCLFNTFKNIFINLSMKVNTANSFDRNLYDTNLIEWCFDDYSSKKENINKFNVFSCRYYSFKTSIYENFKKLGFFEHKLFEKCDRMKRACERILSVFSACTIIDDVYTDYYFPLLTELIERIRVHYPTHNNNELFDSDDFISVTKRHGLYRKLMFKHYVARRLAYISEIDLFTDFIDSKVHLNEKPYVSILPLRQYEISRNAYLNSEYILNRPESTYIYNTSSMYRELYDDDDHFLMKYLREQFLVPLTMSEYTDIKNMYNNTHEVSPRFNLSDNKNLMAFVCDDLYDAYERPTLVSRQYINKKMISI